MTYLRVRNFWDYQNADVWKKAQANKGGHRHPPWCKLHVTRDYELDAQKPVVRLVFYELLRLATVHANAIPNDSQAIANAISMRSQEVSQALENLLVGGWIQETRTPRSSRAPSRKFRQQKKKEKEEVEDRDLSTSTTDPGRGNGWVDNLSAYTGCRYIRGTHAVTAKYDPLGTERPPNDWPHERPTRKEILAALEERAHA